MKKKHDEYRLYLNKDLEDNQLLFSVGDIVIMRPFQITGDDNDVQTIYFLDLIKETTDAIYLELANAIETSDIRGGYGLFYHDIPEFEKRAAIRMRSTEDEIAVIDNDVTQQIMHSEGSFISTLFNSISFRDFVLAGYEYKCAVTEKVIRYDNFMNLEAAHIKPKSHGGSHMPNNGLALGRDMHWAFDKGFYTINDNYEVCVHEKVKSDLLHSYNGKQIFMPSEQFFCPSQNNMQYHRENVYGLFLTSGRL
ncbi:MAG: HNH endonuclease [Oscillospiraceae bacterium]|nr:HNH endonuclease [Oscillospiraceae bacterium]